MLRVTEVLRDAEGGRLVLVDGRLDHPGAAWDQLRLLGRASTAHDGTASVLGEIRHPVRVTEVPEPGDGRCTARC